MIGADLNRLTADEITLEVLKQLVSEETPEGFTLEYKRELGNASKVLTAVAAMANTWGGLILVGIDEQREQAAGFGVPGRDGIVGVPAVDRSRLVNMCSARLVPPFDPVVRAIPLSDGNVVLAVKVYAELAPRPLTFEDRVLVRTDTGNRSADLFRLRELFTNPGTGIPATASSLGNATPFDHPTFTDDPPADLVVRAIASIPFLPSSPRPKLTDSVRKDIQATVSQARISVWLLKMLGNAAGIGLNPWLASGLSTSSQVEFRWEGFPVHGEPECVFPEARLYAELRPNIGGGPTTWLDLRLDVIIRITSLANHTGPPPGSRLRLSLDDLFYLLAALIETFAPSLGVQIQEHIGAPTGTLIGPRVGLITNNGRPISDVIDTHLLKVVRHNLPAAGGELEPDPELNWSNPDDRRRQAVEWMRELLLDLHFANVDQAISRIV
jgi:hypothetical protein